MISKRYLQIGLVFKCVLLTGCTSIDMPKIDFLETPEFAEEAKNIKDYPNVSNAPQAPTDVRSAKAWDKDAREMIAVKTTAGAGEPTVATESPERTSQEIQALKDKARAYQADDPQ